MNPAKVPLDFRAPGSIAQDRRRFDALARAHYENFPVGSWLVPRALRPHIHRIYAFARTADDIADELRDAELLADYRATFTRHLAGTDTSVPLFVDLAATLRERGLPPELCFALLDAFQSDLVERRYTAASLRAYCTKSADPVGRLVLRVFGYDDRELDRLSDSICTGLQILNHLQDVRSDLVERDRIYLPAEDLAAHGVTEADLRANVATPGVRALIRDWTDRTATLLRDGFPLTRAVTGRLRLELRAIVAGAAGVVARIRAHDHDVLARRVRLGRFRAVGWMLRALCTRSLPAPLRPTR